VERHEKGGTANAKEKKKHRGGKETQQHTKDEKRRTFLGSAKYPLCMWRFQGETRRKKTIRPSKKRREGNILTSN